MDDGVRQDFFNRLEAKLNLIHNEKRFDIITITGDLANTRPSEELGVFGLRLGEIFLKTLSIREERIFIVPGNHELVWNDFDKKELSNSPYSVYISFYKDMLPKTLGNIKGFSKGKLPVNLRGDDLSWNRQIVNPALDIIGISSTSSNPEQQGEGYLSPANKLYIESKWSLRKPKPNELRILLLHHNLFPIQSFDGRDENRTLRNAGAAINTMTQYGCDIVLSGHTHRPETVLYMSSSIGRTGYAKNKTLLLIGSGTSGGRTSTEDFAKSFNVIDVAYDVEKKSRRILITPYTFDSKNAVWSEGTYTEYHI
jgi:predicted phosphodiesterase